MNFQGCYVVIRTKNIYHWYDKIGDNDLMIDQIVTIIEYYPDSDNPQYKCKNEKDYWYLEDEELELLK